MFLTLSGTNHEENTCTHCHFHRREESKATMATPYTFSLGNRVWMGRKRLDNSTTIRRYRNTTEKTFLHTISGHPISYINTGNANCLERRNRMLYPGMCTNSLTALWLQSSKTLKHMNSPNNKGLKACPYIKVECNVGTSLSLAFRKIYKTQRTKSMLPPLGRAGKECSHSSHIQGQLRKIYLQNAYVFVYTNFKYTYIGGITYCFPCTVGVQQYERAI